MKNKTTGMRKKATQVMGSWTSPAIALFTAGLYAITYVTVQAFRSERGNLPLVMINCSWPAGSAEAERSSDGQYPTSSLRVKYFSLKALFPMRGVEPQGQKVRRILRSRAGSEPC